MLLRCIPCMPPCCIPSCCMLSLFFAVLSVWLSSFSTASVVSSRASKFGGAFVCARTCGSAGLPGGSGGGFVTAQLINHCAQNAAATILMLVVVVAAVPRWRWWFEPEFFVAH